jgi:4-amino-4-deoxy-L-arabinose transferase-like glycosyltransferase
MTVAGRKWKLSLPDFFCLALLLVFAALKLPHMSLPYHWDELGVYAPGAMYMYEQGPGLLPAALDPEFSHGHPLLFFFLNGLAFRIFGTATWVGHLVPLLLTLGTLVAVYRLVGKFTDPWLGVFAMVILAAQPLFFAQSIMMLPEMALLLWMLLALTAWLQQRYLAYACWSALAILTKETAVILPFIILLYELIIYYNQRKISWSLKWVIVFTPWLVFAIFLLIQKFQNGWFFFPYHIDLVKKDFYSIQTNLKAYIMFLFVKQGRWLLSFSLLAGMIWAMYRKRLWPIQPFPAMCLAVLILGLTFCAMNFYMSRYTLFMLPWLICLLMYLGYERNRVWLLMVSTILMVAAGWQHMNSSRFAVDTDMSYVTYVGKMQEALAYVERHYEPGAYIYPNFPFYYCFSVPHAGYAIGAFPSQILTDEPKTGDWLLKASNGPDKEVFQHFDQVAPDTVIQVFPNAQFIIGRMNP